MKQLGSQGWAAGVSGCLAPVFRGTFATKEVRELIGGVLVEQVGFCCGSLQQRLVSGDTCMNSGVNVGKPDMDLVLVSQKRNVKLLGVGGKSGQSVQTKSGV